MTTNKTIRELLDATAYDADGDKLGNVNEVFLDDDSSAPDFVEISHGLFGKSSALVPLAGYTLTEGKLRLAFAKETITKAPSVANDNHLTSDDKQALNEHYGIGGGA